MIGLQKKCSKCGVIKALEEFANNKREKDGLQRVCRECNNAFGKKNYQENKERYFQLAKQRDAEIKALVNQFKDKPCADCGVKYPPYVMDFDHIHAQLKYANVSYLKRHRVSMSTLLLEIGKCEVVCANCHRIRSYKRQQEKIKSGEFSEFITRKRRVKQLVYPELDKAEIAA